MTTAADGERIRSIADAAPAAKEAAKLIVADARSAAAARGPFVIALSSGRMPWQMLRPLAGEDVP